MTSVVQADSSADLAATCTMGAGLTLRNWLLMAATAYNATAYPAGQEVNGAAVAATAILQGGTLTGLNSVAFTIWLAQVSSAMAGQTALSFTPPGGSGGAIKLHGIEISSPSALALDQPYSTTGTGTGGSVSIGPSPGSAQPGELAVMLLPVFSGNPSVTGGGFTIIGGSNLCACGYQSLGAAGSTAGVTATLPSGDQWAAGIVTLMAVNLGAPPPLVVPSRAAIQAACW